MFVVTEDDAAAIGIDLRLEKLDLSRLMARSRASQGAGSLSGVAAVDATGNSVAALLANSDGGVKLAMVGGELSALLVDLSGLHFGNACSPLGSASSRANGPFSNGNGVGIGAAGQEGG